MSDPLLIAIVGGIAATVVGGLLIEPVRRFLRAAGRFSLRVLAGVARGGFAALAASVPGWVLLVAVAAAALVARMTSIPVWVLLIAAGVVTLAARWIGRRRAAPIERARVPAGSEGRAAAAPVRPRAGRDVLADRRARVRGLGPGKWPTSRSIAV